MTEKDLLKLEKKITGHGNVPRHVAVIMDGNGRWARRRGLPRIAGHHAAIKAVREAVKGCADLNVDYLTLYTFSVENWKRPAREVNALMRFLRETLKKETEQLNKSNVRLRVIGRPQDLPESVIRELSRASRALEKNTGLTLVLALSYGGRVEILEAARRIAAEARRGRITERDVDAELFGSYLYTAGMPDPDLLIRTSGEMRVSNFLLWQIAYAEMWVTETLWPDFRREHLYRAVAEYQKRERRFGRIAPRSNPKQ